MVQRDHSKYKMTLRQYQKMKIAWQSCYSCHEELGAEKLTLFSRINSPAKFPKDKFGETSKGSCGL